MRLTPYADVSGESGVVAYAIEPDAIVVEFKNAQRYRYSYVRPGRDDVEAMKERAIAGQGLATYISRQVRGRYESKVE